jgi:hypothetical protein
MDLIYIYAAAGFTLGFGVAASVFRSKPKAAAPVVTSSSTEAIPSQTTPPAPQPESPHASGLFFLSMLQREGRFVDFVQEDIAQFNDEQVGAAARVVHEGCRKIVRQYLALEPVLPQEEGAPVEVPKGFDAERIRLTGNVQGEAPFKGSLKHHGWVAKEVKLPNPPVALDLRILAPAEVELS